jgi:putative protein-disulfide isomerase
MCSWCWGFTPTFDRIRERFDQELRFALVMGGLRPYTKEMVTDSFREEILHHWRDVQEMTGQAFSFEGAMPEGFIYDSEPPARAVLTAGRLEPERGFEIFKAIQQAFYVNQIDITRTDQLVELLSGFGIQKRAFLVLFESEELRAMTQQHFVQTRQYGVRGFPTLTLGPKEHPIIITSGYQPFSNIESRIKSWLDSQENQ